MRMRKYILNLFAATALFASCNESLEDTYSDYAGDGKIRYVARCMDLRVTPGWHRLKVTWVNGTDAMIDKIKIRWSSEDLKDSTLLPGTSTSFELKNVTDGNYRFDVYAMDSIGNLSLRETVSGRPYTRDHEVMLAFTRGIVKSYFLDNKMIFFSDQWNKNIEEMYLKYKTPEGKTERYTFEEGKSYNTLVTIENVSMNPKDTIYLFRKGRLEDCLDIVEFDSLAVSRKKNFSGFVHAIKRRYGYSMDSDSDAVKFEKFVEEVETLDFDYDIETFEDVLHCPNLKLLRFCPNRYLDQVNKFVSEATTSKLLGSPEKSVTVLKKANELLGMTIECYGGRYNPYLEPYECGIDDFWEKPMDMETWEEGYPSLPDDLVYLEKEDFKEYDNGYRILCTPKDIHAKLDDLLDDDYTTIWVTTASSRMRTHELRMELNEETEINGVKVVQALYFPWGDGDAAIVPAAITAQTSLDGTNWEDVTFLSSNDLGRDSGETTLLPIAEG